MLPGYNSMRSMDRIINIDLLFFGIAAAWCFEYAFRKNVKWQFPVFILMVILLGLDNYVHPEKTYRTEKRIAVDRFGNMVQKMEDIPLNSVISYEPDSVDNAVAVQLDAMLASQYLGLKCLNGYTATSPGKYTPYWFHPDENTRKIWLKSVNADTLKVYVIK